MARDTRAEARERSKASLKACGLAALTAVGRTADYAPGAAIVRQGEVSQRFSILVDGRAKMSCVTPAGRALILGLFAPGDVIGFAAALSGNCQRASVVASERCICHEVDRSDLFRLLRRRPELAEKLLASLSRHLVDCRNCILESVTRRVESRFAHLFLRLSSQLGHDRGDGLEIPLRLSRQELAELAGTSTETAIRVMSGWGRRGLVETRGDGFVVHDRSCLERLARG